MELKAFVLSQLKYPSSIWSGTKNVRGASMVTLKKALADAGFRGLQDQKRFVATVDSLGMKSAWGSQKGDPYAGWIVYDPNDPNNKGESMKELRGLNRLQEALLAAGAATMREALADKVVKKIPYRGFTITVYEVHSERFGRMYWADNDIGEPYLDSPKFWPNVDKAVAVAKGDVDDYEKENG